MKVIVDKDIPFIKGVLEEHANVVYLPGRGITRADVSDADALIIRTRTICNEELLKGTAVKFIASATIGFDHIDTEYCRNEGIYWTNAKGCNSYSVKQYIGAGLLTLANKLEMDLAGKTIGIVGVGNVGSKVATLCEALGMRVLLNDPPRERAEGSAAFVSLDKVVQESDIVTFHVPLERKGPDKTFHLVDEKFLKRTRPGQMLFNTSRGEVVETSALVATLKERKLAGCVLDVWEHEPEIDLELMHLVEIATPHIAGYSADGKANGTSMSVQALSHFFHLGLDSWFPGDVPVPDQTEIELDCRNLKKQKIACKLVGRTYDIRADNQRLRNSPRTFEHQRALYPLRREFPAYTARLLNATDDVRAMAKRIGFKITASPQVDQEKRTFL